MARRHGSNGAGAEDRQCDERAEQASDTGKAALNERDNSAIKTPSRDGLARYVPALHWMREYDLQTFGRDAPAGLFLAVLLVPQAMAYALLADLPPQVGLYASIAPPLLYVLFGTSRFLSIGPVALVSLLVAETIATAAPGHAPTEVALALALLVGTLLMLMGLLRLGFLVNFISDPVLVGFTSGAALLIAATQLRNLFGLDVPRGSFVETIQQLFANFDQIEPVTTAIAVGVLLLLLLSGSPLDRTLANTGVSKRAQLIISKATPLVLVLASMMLVGFLNLKEVAGVEVVGGVDAGLPPVGLPPLDLALYRALLPGALAIGGIIFVTAAAVAKSLAGRRRQQIVPDQEAVGLGVAGIAAALTGGYPVGASLSRSALNFDLGARTPVASAIGAVLVLLSVLVLGPLFQYLPKAALAALIISAVIGLFDARAMRRIWRYSRAEGITLLLTFGAVLLLGVYQGIAAGAVAGIALYLWRTSRPRIVVEGQMDGRQEFRSLDREDVVDPLSYVLILRADQNLYFANTSYVEDRVLKAVAEQQEIIYVLLDLKSVPEIDVSGYQMLDRLVDNLAEAGVTVTIAEAKRPVLKRLQRGGLLRKLGDARIFVTAADALAALEVEYTRAGNEDKARGKHDGDGGPVKDRSQVD